MNGLLQKQNYIAIVPSKETYFYATSLPKNVKLSKELLKLNYESRSPFKPKEIIVLAEKTELLLWFCANDVTAPVAIPEDYLLYLTLKKRHANAIVLLQTPESKKVLVIKDARLINAFSVDNADANFVEMSKDEYEIQEVANYSQEEYATLLERSQKQISLPLLYRFFKADLQPKELLKKAVDKLSYPLSFLLVFTILINFYHNNSLEKEIDSLTKDYKDVQQGNQDLIEAMRKHNARIKFYEEFESKEMLHPDPLLVLEKVYDVLQEDGESFLYSLSATKGKLTAKIQTSKSPVELLNKLSNLSEFQRVLLGTTHRPKAGAPIYTYNVTLSSMGAKK